MLSLAENPILGHITTFGGHPVSAAAALANLEVIVEGRLWEAAPSIEARFRSQLQHPLIQRITGMGAMLAVHLPDVDIVQQTIQYCLENGLIIDWFLFNPNSLRISPPLTLTHDEIDFAAQTIIEALELASKS
jgi:4-aminobutyrate aminotransferase-like enzyme